MTDSTTKPIGLSPFDWQEAEVESLLPGSRFRFRRIEWENPSYDEMFTVISVFDKRFLEVLATKCDDNMRIKAHIKEFSFSCSDIVLVIPFHEKTIANEAKHD